MDIGFKLEEVQVTPGPFDGIMHVAFGFAAFCASKFAAGFEIYMNIELLAFGTKIYQRDVPGMFEIQCYFEEVFL